MSEVRLSDTREILVCVESHPPHLPQSRKKVAPCRASVGSSRRSKIYFGDTETNGEYLDEFNEHDISSNDWPRSKHFLETAILAVGTRLYLLMALILMAIALTGYVLRFPNIRYV